MATRLPPEALGWLSRAMAAQQAGRYREAEPWYRRILAQFPQTWEVRNDLGNLLINMGRGAEAEQTLAQVVQEAPDYAAGWCNWGNALVALERREEAAQAYLRSAQLDPSFTAAPYNLSLVRLAQGRMQEGWDLYEARWACDLKDFQRHLDLPRWTGEGDWRGQRVLVHAEQGLGDTLQFCRYAKALAQAGVEVVLEVQAPLVELLRFSLPELTVVARGEAGLTCTAQIPLLSLPRLCWPRGLTWLTEAPYLQAEPSRVARWAATLPPTHLPRVGLVWSANVRHWRGALRNAGPIAFARALAEASVAPVALMKEVPPEDQAAARRWLNVGPSLKDFADTAAVIASLDLVLTVDTSVAHLAGALGKPTWLWLAFGGDWRWFLARPDSPFYPSVRVFRQPKAGDWATVAEEVGRALGDFAKTHSPR